METHAHDLHKAPGHGWKHYFFEFFMLFLAVFCGFMAENIREHIVEQDREKQYMQSLLEDLKSDTAEMQSKLTDIDSFYIPVLKKSTDLLYSENFSDSTIRQMYETVPLSLRFFDLQFEKRTIDQLKNSGNLRLIRDKKITDSLATYIKSCDVFTNITLPSYEETRRTVKEFCFSLFNNNYYEGKSAFSPLIKNKPLKLLSTDKTEFIKLSNYIGNLHSQLRGAFTVRLKATIATGGRLMVLIKEKYHLENE